VKPINNYDFETEGEKRVVSMYLNGRHIDTIIKETDFSQFELYNILDKYNIPRRKVREQTLAKDKLSNKEIKEIKEKYLDRDFTITDIENDHDISRTVLYDIVKESEIKMRKDYSRITEDTKQEIKRLYLETKLNIKEIIEKIGCSYTSFNSVIKELPKQKIAFRKKFNGFTKKELKEIKYLHLGTGINMEEIGNYYSVGTSKIKTLIKKLNLPNLSDFRIAWVNKLSKKDGLLNKEIASIVGLHFTSVSRILIKTKNKNYVNFPELIKFVENFERKEELKTKVNNLLNKEEPSIKNKEVEKVAEIQSGKNDKPIQKIKISGEIKISGDFVIEAGGMEITYNDAEVLITK